jgi:hypothetical protein
MTDAKVYCSGVELLGEIREDRRLDATAKLVVAHTRGGEAALDAQHAPAAFLDLLETKLETADGARRRTLLEVYDLMLDAVDRCCTEPAQRRRQA